MAWIQVLDSLINLLNSCPFTMANYMAHSASIESNYKISCVEMLLRGMLANRAGKFSIVLEFYQ